MYLVDNANEDHKMMVTKSATAPATRALPRYRVRPRFSLRIVAPSSGHNAMVTASRSLEKVWEEQEPENHNHAFPDSHE